MKCVPDDAADVCFVAACVFPQVTIHGDGSFEGVVNPYGCTVFDFVRVKFGRSWELQNGLGSCVTHSSWEVNQVVQVLTFGGLLLK